MSTPQYRIRKRWSTRLSCYTYTPQAYEKCLWWHWWNDVGDEVFTEDAAHCRIEEYRLPRPAHRTEYIPVP